MRFSSGSEQINDIRYIIFTPLVRLVLEGGLAFLSLIKNDCRIVDTT